jgi:hypothetical protein
MANGAATLASSVGLVETPAGTVVWRTVAHFQTCGGLDPDLEIGFASFWGLTAGLSNFSGHSLTNRL